MKKFLVLVLTTLAFFLLMRIIALKVIPADFHPTAWAVSITGLALAIMAQVKKRLDSLTLSTFMGWLAWVIAIKDNTCPAGFVGFFALTIIYIGIAIFGKEYKLARAILLSIGIVLMTVAFILNIYYPG